MSAGHPEFVQSIELIWVVWAASLVSLCWLTIHFLNRIRWPHLRQLVRDEDGAAYTLSYVMVIPMYVFFMCVVVETSLVILAKFGTNHAAFAAARSAVVHYSGKDLNMAQAWAQRAAVQSFVPFANGVTEPGDSSGSDQEIERYLNAYKAYAKNPASERYLRSKYQYARQHIKATTDFKPYDPPRDKEPWLKDGIVTVEYRFAFHVPIVGRLLGQTDTDGTYYMVTSSAMLDSEAPKNDDELLGINYEPTSPD